LGVFGRAWSAFLPTLQALDSDSPVHAGEAAVLAGNLEDAVQAEEVEGSAASLEDDDMGSDEEGRLAVM
jgi:hypothetical protein